MYYNHQSTAILTAIEIAIGTGIAVAIATIGTAAVMSQVDWKMAISASALAGVISLLTSIAGLPECKQDNPGTIAK